MRKFRLFARLAVPVAGVLLLAIVLLGPSDKASPTDSAYEANPCVDRSESELKREEAREATEPEAKAQKESVEAERKNEDCELQEPSDVMLTRQLFGNDKGLTPPDVLRSARAAEARIAQDTRNRAPGVSDAEWRLDGPTSVGGRVLDIAVDPDLKDTIFIATASGGVWKSTDAGTTFSPSWPRDQNQVIGALVNTKDGTLFAGTGETGPGGGSITYGGDGLYRSRDKGRTWQKIGLENTSRIGRIMVDPSNQNRILVAASGNLFKGTPDRGVYLSENGGDTWTQVLKGDNPTTGAADLATNADGSIMFATTWDHQRTPDQRRYEGLGSALYKSTDHGKTWTKVLTGPFQNNPQLGRMGVVMGHGDAGKNTAFVVTTTSSGTFGGLYKTTDGGTTWTPRSDVALAGNGSFVYGWWFGRLWLDPKNNQRLFVAGVCLNESTNDGVSFTSECGALPVLAGTPTAPHADQHAMAWDPKVPDRVYLGNDGGVYRSDTNGSRGSWKFAKYQPFSQPYTIDVSEQDPSRLVAGLQDNGVIKSWGAKDGSWPMYHGGDGERSLIKPDNKNFLYGCHQYGECTKHTRGGAGDSEDITRKIVSQRRNWTMPIEFDPEDTKTIYTGGEFLERSTDDAGTFVPVSPDLTNGPGREANPLFRNYGTLTSIAPAGKSKKVIYVGTDDGNLWVGDPDSPTSWKKLADPDLPKAWITRVEVNRANPKVAYVTYSGFRSGDDAAYILRTRDGGATWDNITGELPKAPLNDVNIVGDAVFVAGDLGVFVSRDEGKSWYKVGANLPLTPVFELRYHAGTNRLFAGTFGRSIWSMALADLGKVPGVGKTPATIVGDSPFANAPGVSGRGVVMPRLGLSLRSCLRTNRLRFKLRVPRGTRVRSVSIRVNGKRVSRRLATRSRRRAITLRLSSRRKRNTVVVSVRTRDGKSLTERRTYTKCKRKATKRRSTRRRRG